MPPPVPPEPPVLPEPPALRVPPEPLLPPLPPPLAGMPPRPVVLPMAPAAPASDSGESPPPPATSGVPPFAATLPAFDVSASGFAALPPPASTKLEVSSPPLLSAAPRPKSEESYTEQASDAATATAATSRATRRLRFREANGSVWFFGVISVDKAGAAQYGLELRVFVRTQINPTTLAKRRCVATSAGVLVRRPRTRRYIRRAVSRAITVGHSPG